MQLVHEGRTIQHRLPQGRNLQNDDEKFVKTFTNLVYRGKMKEAIRMLNKQAKRGRILSLDDEVEENGSTKYVRDILRDKHPDGKPANIDVIVNTDEQSDPETHPVIFDSIDALAIRQAALRVQGAAGPSGTDAQAWRRFVTSFGRSSDDLCSAIACVARKIATTYVDPNGLKPYLTCRLIALDKCPGVRPIGNRGGSPENSRKGCT